MGPLSNSKKLGELSKRLRETKVGGEVYDIYGQVYLGTAARVVGKVAFDFAAIALMVVAAHFVFELLSAQQCVSQCFERSTECCLSQPLVLLRLVVYGAILFWGSCISTKSLADRKMQRSTMLSIIVIFVTAVRLTRYLWPLWLVFLICLTEFFLVYYGYRMSFILWRRNCDGKASTKT